MIKTVYELYLLASTTNILNLLTSTIHKNIFQMYNRPRGYLTQKEFYYVKDYLFT